MRVVITGGLGFIGTATVQALLAFGEECVLIQRQSAEIPEGRFSRTVTSVQADVKDIAALRAIGREHEITGIVHLAGSMPWPADPDLTAAEDARRSLGGLFNLVEVAAEWGVARVALASTIGVYAGLPHTGALTEPVLRDPRLRKLSFTGSTPVGKKLIAQAAENVLRTSMELGGNAPFLVFDDADLDAAVTGAMLAKFRNVGEACTAANRFIVHEAVADEFAERLTAKVAALKVGRGTEDGVRIGPLINAAAVEKADVLVQEAVGRGAEVRLGGGPVDGPGTFYAPTVLDRVDAGSDILRTEIFGPVVSIVRFREESEAVRIANDTEFGLVSYVFTKDLARGQRMIERLETGMMGLNAGVISNASAPFGGVKQSGIGREGGFEGIHEYLSTKYTMTPAP